MATPPATARSTYLRWPFRCRRASRIRMPIRTVSSLRSDLKPNDNFIGDEQVSAYYGGRLGYGIGAFIQVTYEGRRQARIGTIWTSATPTPRSSLGRTRSSAFTVNNDPTIEDLWNSPPGWGFPYNSSSIAPSPAAATLVDGALAQQVLGAGAYAMWNDFLYVEGTVYRNLSRYMLERLGRWARARRQSQRFLWRWHSLWAHRPRAWHRQSLFPNGRVYARGGSVSGGRPQYWHLGSHRRPGARCDLSIRGKQKQFRLSACDLHPRG